MFLKLLFCLTSSAKSAEMYSLLTVVLKKKKEKSTVVFLFKGFLKHFVFKTMVQELNYV